MTNIKFQNYSHYKLPITMEPLKYGKLLDQTNNKFIMQLSTKNVAVITQYDKQNFIRIFKNGDLVLEFKDKFINENSFIRTLNDTRFLFDNDKLISTEILSTASSIKIYENKDAITFNNNNPLYLRDEDHIPILSFFMKNIPDPVIAFLVWELCLIIFFYILIIVIPNYFLNIDSNLIISSFVPTIILCKQKLIGVKLKKTIANYKWEDLSFNVKNKLFSQELFFKIFNQFWNKIDIYFSENNHMFILFKIKYVTGQTLSIGKVQRLNKNDKNWYSDFILNFIELKASFYNETQIESLIFSYGFKSGKVENKVDTIYNGLFQNYNNYQIPISMNPVDYGVLMNKIDMKDSVFYFLQNKKGFSITIQNFKDHNLVEFFKNGISLIKFKDVFINENKFMRTIENKKFYFINGEQILLTSEIKTKFIKQKTKAKNLVNKFITIDIETYSVDGILTPYLICFYDGKNFYSFYLSNYNSVEQMMLDCLKSILKRKYKGYNVYAHNLAKFDIIFLLKYLVKLGNIKPIFHNGKIIFLTVNYGENGQYKIVFKDSLLLLLSSLKSLCKSFNIEESKTVFPHLFINKNNLNYKGKVPEFKYFIATDKNEYQDYKSKHYIWNLKEEAIKYCKIDCISLYQILLKFNDKIFNLFNINIHQYPTLSSLAFNIFKSNFMKENVIPQLSGKIADDIRKGYTGGAVDMYIPKGKNIKAYDVNSLYPSQMQNQMMPVGKPTFFNGNILNIDKNAFGFFYCKITSPDELLHPILQTRVKVNGILKTIAPIGTWEDMLFSEEMYNAEKFGYKFDILWGYTFESENIFKDYVEFLYNLRLTYPKSDPMNFIAKILLNSLYGRFGMDDNFPDITIFDKINYFKKWFNEHNEDVIDFMELGNKVLVQHRSELLDQKTELYGTLETHNISIFISAAITAYARIHMSHFKIILKLTYIILIRIVFILMKHQK